jgi:plastocyanin
MQPRSLRAPAGAAVAVAAIALSAVAVVSDATARGSSVSIAGQSAATYKFEPKTVHAKKGKAVHWNWD